MGPFPDGNWGVCTGKIMFLFDKYSRKDTGDFLFNVLWSSEGGACLSARATLGCWQEIAFADPGFGCYEAGRRSRTETAEKSFLNQKCLCSLKHIQLARALFEFLLSHDFILQYSIITQSQCILSFATKPEESLVLPDLIPPDLIPHSTAVPELATVSCAFLLPSGAHLAVFTAGATRAIRGYNQLECRAFPLFIQTHCVLWDAFHANKSQNCAESRAEAMAAQCLGFFFGREAGRSSKDVIRKWRCDYLE